MSRLLSGRAETSAVKTALIEAGLRPLRVYRGRGTAYGWLHVLVQGPAVPTGANGWEDRDSRAFTERERIKREVAGVIERVTGRDSSQDDMMTDLFLSQYIVEVEPVPWFPVSGVAP